MKHKHYNTIIAFANGEQIQYFSTRHQRWLDTPEPGFSDALEFRVKPKDMTTYLVPDFTSNGRWNETVHSPITVPHIKIVRDGSTTKVKSAEVIHG
jgi:hypothetical protein